MTPVGRRTGRLKLLQRLLAFVVACLVVATVGIAVFTAERQTALRNVARYNAAWTVTQALAEFMRLEHRLAAYAVPNSGVSFDEVKLRLDIVFARLKTLEYSGKEEYGRGRSLLQFIRSDPANERIIADLQRATETVDAMIKADGPAFNVTAALETLRPLDAQLTELNSKAAAYGAALGNQDRAELQRLHYVFTGLAFGLILCGIALILLLRYNNRLLARAHASLTDLADELRGTSQTLQAQNDRFDAALNNMSQALCTFDADGRLVVYNAGFAQVTGEDLERGATLSSLLDNKLSTFSLLFAKQAPFMWAKRKMMFAQDLDDGRSFAVSHSPLPDGGWLATYEDVSEPRRAQARIEHMAHHDALTDLPNRLLFHQQLERLLSQPCEADRCVVTVLLLDLDGFKDVNDTRGHSVGDKLLQSVAARLRGFADRVEAIARLGGDEFAVVVSGQASQSLELGERLVRSVSAPFWIDDHELSVSVSIGAAERGADEHYTPEELVRRADLALYRAKAEGRGRVRLYDPELDALFLKRKSLEADLRKSLDNNEMEVHYQAILDTATRQVRGYEALLRWNHPELGMVPPVEFIPIAEDVGFIVTLGEWVLRQACKEAATWPDHFTIAVNLSPIQFRSATLAETVVDALSASGLSPHQLELEVTESVLLDAEEKTVSTLLQLKQIGIRIAIDDFGTGYSSLSTLHSFPFDKIKIDRSFVRELTTQVKAHTVVQLIVSLGEALGMTTTAEGVETEEEFAALRKMGCSQVQGYLFARPMPASQLHHLSDAGEREAIAKGHSAQGSGRRARSSTAPELHA
jgi:diguanylate cyclase (GGDEF)-like protein